MKLHYDLFHFKRYLLYIYVVFVVFNRLLIIFFCHLSIAIVCLPVSIDWIVVRNHS